MAVSDYLAIITSGNNQKPNLMAWVKALCQPFADTQFQLQQLPYTRDLDYAVGDQLDQLGVLIGASRNLPEPLPPTDITVLDDNDYRQLLRAVIAINHWDGTTPGIYAIWDAVFGDTLVVLVQDNQDMTMLIVVFATTFSTVALALLVEGYFNLRPAGVTMLGYFQPSVPATPAFGWGLETVNVKGWGQGCWIEPLVVP